MTFDLNLLLTFEAMDKARSVSGAARLSRLRQALGDELFSYAGGTMQPTPKARRLAPGLHAALSALRTVLDAEQSFVPEAASGSFVLGMTEYASAVIAPALSAQIAATAPGIVEQRAATLATYDTLRRAAQEKPTLTLFTHDPANAAKLAAFATPA